MGFSCWGSLAAVLAAAPQGGRLFLVEPATAEASGAVHMGVARRVGQLMGLQQLIVVSFGGFACSSPQGPR